MLMSLAAPFTLAGQLFKNSVVSEAKLGAVQTDKRESLLPWEEQPEAPFPRRGVKCITSPSVPHCVVMSQMQSYVHCLLCFMFY